MIRQILNKIRSFFSKNNQTDKAIPFADTSKNKIYQKDKEDYQQAEKDNLRKTKKPSPPKPKNRKPKWTLDEFQVEPSEGQVRFHDLKLPIKLMRAICDMKYQYCTPIQAEILPHTLKKRDAIGQAQTGTGKTAAFLITVISHMIRNPIKGGPPKGKPRVLILAPTRELVLQIEKEASLLTKYTPFNVLSVFGGMDYNKQIKQIKSKSYDIIVATPGRLIDYINKKLFHLKRVEVLVIDEADRMLDMGFIPDIKRIIYSTPHKDVRHTMFYSATFSDQVERLANSWTKNPLKINIQPEHVAAESVHQTFYITLTEEKFILLYNILIQHPDHKVIVFTNTRIEANDIHSKLKKYGIESLLLSGEVHQKKRIKSLNQFKSDAIRVLVATDVAARGIHVDDVTHVINYNIPFDAEHYIHRIGRTGRAGASGSSISFACEEDSFYIPPIEKLLGDKIECVYPPDELFEDLPDLNRNENSANEPAQ